MKSTGMVRRIDNLGRLVLPRELRKTLNLNQKDSVEIFVNGQDVILRKYNPGCIVCGGMDSLKEVKGKHICSECIDVAK